MLHQSATNSVFFGSGVPCGVPSYGTRRRWAIILDKLPLSKSIVPPRTAELKNRLQYSVADPRQSDNPDNAAFRAEMLRSGNARWACAAAIPP